MLVRINNKSIKVKKEDDKDGIDWMYLSVSCVGYSFIFYVLDYAASVFMGFHPFPFIMFMGRVLSWFSF